MDVLSPQVAVYRIFDVSESIDLGNVAGPRTNLLRPRGGAVHFENPPIGIDLGPRAVGGKVGFLTARLYEFGVVALSWRILLKEKMNWDDFVSEAFQLAKDPAFHQFFLGELHSLKNSLGPALLRPTEEGQSEEFTVLHVRGTDPAMTGNELLALPGSTELLLAEKERFSRDVRQDLHRYAFTYTQQDLAVLAFDRVLILDPKDIWDIADLVEFAHAELVELAYYDRILSQELKGVRNVLRNKPLFSLRGYNRLRRRLMELHAEIAEMHSRLRGALKVTEDLFYARIFKTAMELYGVKEIDALIGERLRVLNEAYGMLAEEGKHFRSTLLELGVFFLILIEVFRLF